MRISGEDVEPKKALTVGELRAFLNAQAARDPNIDGNLVHMLRMEGTDDDPGVAYVTHVDLDCFEGTEADPDDPNYKAIWVVSLMHWPSRCP